MSLSGFATFPPGLSARQTGGRSGASNLADAGANAFFRRSIPLPLNLRDISQTV
jgi:hypothetical protein